MNIELFAASFQISKKLDPGETKEKSNFILSLEYFKIHDLFEIRTFDLLKKRNSYFVTITRNNSDIRCSCKEFLKKYVCKHSLGIGIVLGFVEAQKLPLESIRPVLNGQPLEYERNRLN